MQKENCSIDVYWIKKNKNPIYEDGVPGANQT
jgi:hypothetical protein